MPCFSTVLNHTCMIYWYYIVERYSIVTQATNKINIKIAQREYQNRLIKTS